MRRSRLNFSLGGRGQSAVGYWQIRLCENQILISSQLYTTMCVLCLLPQCYVTLRYVRPCKRGYLQTHATRNAILIDFCHKAPNLSFSRMSRRRKPISRALSKA
ncbi:hypothetical protein EJ05DRAFT_351552 [Pseudovirgaria hyperparasitica]|uniref:Uncharacterized protein n=1 Tax=Pseudovirgaria hyperparasitica TaxID=470096 RepID=A0A6A6W6E9_9PEZI|nr:uncharacterized protein EJ05DRAFT_351552 [Pseudovirgaria hyperparasitica]KAF2758452.1 hypothetical protein EJ05DRAFT_351552 [Pseudovirgaria hyperparasitica]